MWILGVIIANALIGFIGVYISGLLIKYWSHLLGAILWLWPLLTNEPLEAFCCNLVLLPFAFLLWMRLTK